ncbi:hypothetical protein HDU97_003822 [Phlyctochytrium planicorne]|nr:hypothetical protein HDU97_003822 [Phlyctochytrium planicorne]
MSVVLQLFMAVVLMLASLSAGVWSKVVFIVGYIVIAWLATMFWRCGVFRILKARFPPLADIKKIVFQSTLATPTMVVPMFLYAIIVEVYRAFPDSIITSTVLYLAIVIVRQYLLVMLSKSEVIENVKEKRIKAQKGYNTILIIGLATPFQLTKGTNVQISADIYWTYLVASQILEMWFHRFVAYTVNTKFFSGEKRKVVDSGVAHKPEYIDLDIAISTSLPPLPPVDKFESRSTQAGSGGSCEVFKTTVIFAAIASTSDESCHEERKHESDNKSPQPESDSNSSEMKMSEVLSKSASISFRHAPYEYIRRDICFSDHCSSFLAVGLMLLFPMDFLPPGHIIGESHSFQGWIKDLGAFYSGSNFVQIILAWLIPFVISIPCEYLIILWEEAKGEA